MPLRVLQFVATLLTALCLVPGGAHVLEIAGKIGLGQADYLVVQQIYRGWSLLGIVLIAAVVANGLAAVGARGQRTARLWSAAACALICVTLVIFLVWTYPVNQATQNWTVAPGNWQVLRRQWEYSHAVNAGVTFVALCCAIAAGMARSGRSRTGRS
ncbi:MAG TPA: DUF1772 domain-containing protein [Rhodopila sp.]|nr:DUF1772 domain-containing protein [Rhodopila sp.]